MKIKMIKIQNIMRNFLILILMIMKMNKKVNWKEKELKNK